MRAFVSHFIGFCLMVLGLAAAPTPTSFQLKLTGSPVFGTGKTVVVRDAALFIDSTNFDGKSGMVRLQKAMTAIYLVISTREIGSEFTGTFEKKAFLQRNVTPLPKLPDLSAPDDFVIIIGFNDAFDPKIRRVSMLLEDLWPQTVPGAAAASPAVETYGTRVESIHLHTVDAAVRTPSSPGKAFGNNAPFFRSGLVVHAFNPRGREAHFQSQRDRPPFADAPVVLRREDDRWTAEVALTAKELSIHGRVPVRLREPVSRTINEYAGRK